MHTIQTAIVFSTVLFFLCACVSAGPKIYARTACISELSVTAQNIANQKDSIFEVRSLINSVRNWEIEVSCPEKAYRLGKGVRDSLSIVLG